MSRRGAHHPESLGAALWFIFQTKGRLLPKSVGHVGHMGYRERAAWDCSGFIIGYLREEPKVRKGGALGSLENSKCGKQRNKGIKESIFVETGGSK